MALAVKKLNGYLPDGQRWSIILKAQKSNYIVNGTLLSAIIYFDGIYQFNEVVSYKLDKTKDDFKKVYTDALRRLLNICENKLGVEILKSKLQIAV